MAEVEAQQVQSQNNPMHIDHIMKSGFTMNDIKGLQRYGDDMGEVDDQPSRPTRKGSVQRGSPTYDSGPMARSASALDIDYQDDKAEKKRGRSPFNFFKKSRDHSKDKKSRSPPDRNRGTGKFYLLTFFY